MTSVTQFERMPCPKFDALDIDAYFMLYLDEINPPILKLESSWGCTSVDLTPAVKSAETITHLFLSPPGAPTSLQFNREDYGRDGVEDGGVDCIHGDDLSRIISMQLLKDVDQSKPVGDGDVYMYNYITNMFEPWDLKTFAKNVKNTLEIHEGAINILQTDVAGIQNTLELVLKRLTNIENRLGDLEKRVSNIENAIYNWGNDKTTPIARGNINIYGDYANTGSTARGIYTHSTSSNVNGDQKFA